jgi:cysteine-rich repeat protein
MTSLFLSFALGCGQPGAEGAECGNGTLEAGELCDDGNLEDGDGCDSACELELIEDECGDGVLSTGEQCDDGNSLSGDGCSASCSIEVNEAEQIDEYIQGLAQLPAEENTGPTLGEPSEPQVDPTNSDYECATQEFTQIQRSVEISSFSANASNLFPGALIRGDSVYNDLIDPVVLPLKPVQFSLSLQNLNDASSGTMQTPNIAEFRDKRNELLSAGVSGDVVVNSDIEIVQVNSKEELSIVLGVDVNTATVDVGADFNFESTEERSHFLVRAKQI